MRCRTQEARDADCQSGAVHAQDRGGTRKFAARGSSVAGSCGFWVPASRSCTTQDRQRGVPDAKPAERTTIGESEGRFGRRALRHVLRRGDGGFAGDSKPQPGSIRHPLIARFISARDVEGLHLRRTIKPPRVARRGMGGDESGHGPLSVAGPTVPAVDPRPLAAKWNRFRRAGCG